MIIHCMRVSSREGMLLVKVCYVLFLWDSHHQSQSGDNFFTSFQKVLTSTQVVKMSLSPMRNTLTWTTVQSLLINVVLDISLC